MLSLEIIKLNWIMIYWIIIFVVLSLIIVYSIFVINYRLRLNNTEDILKNNFKKRNYKMVSLFYASKNFLNKHNEVFEEYINLTQKDFSETSLNFVFENKLDTYKKIHYEINFIFKICEANAKLKDTWKYNYIKEEILKESAVIWKKYEIYKKSLAKYEFHHKISKFFLVWLFLR